MNDALHEQMRAGMQKLARRGDPLVCECWSTTDNNGVLHVEWCPAHKREAMAAQIAFGATTYVRAFNRECDARDRAHIVKHLMRREDKRAQVVQVERFWLVLASWGRVKVGGWNQP